jgi:hypothetical protein
MSAPILPTVPEGPRHAIVTPDDHGPILNIVSWFLLSLMIQAIVLRLTLRVTTAHVPGIDDGVAVAATVRNPLRCACVRYYANVWQSVSWYR